MSVCVFVCEGEERETLTIVHAHTLTHIQYTHTHTYTRHHSFKDIPHTHTHNTHTHTHRHTHTHTHNPCLRTVVSVGASCSLLFPPKRFFGAITASQTRRTVSFEIARTAEERERERGGKNKKGREAHCDNSSSPFLLSRTATHSTFNPFKYIQNQQIKMRIRIYRNELRSVCTDGTRVQKSFSRRIIFVLNENFLRPAISKL